MAWSFNVFTGNLDQTGSGAVVFEGEVATFADLPQTVGDPAVGSSYLVRESTGVWLVNRKQAGIWIRSNNTGVRDTDWTYGGDYPVNSVNGKTGNVSLGKSDVGLGNVSNTAQVTSVSGTAPIVSSGGTTPAISLQNSPTLTGDVRVNGASAGVTGSLQVGSTTGSFSRDAELNGGGLVLRNIGASGVVTIARAPHGTFNYTLTPPAASGTIALTSDIPSTFAASAITSGVLDNARINFAAPSAIGSTTPSTGAFTTLSASGAITAAAGTAGTPTTPATALGVQWSGLGGTDIAAVYGTYSGAGKVGIGVGTSGILTEVASFALGGIALNRATTVSNGTLTASAPVLDLSQTWNNAAVTFAGMRLNVTNTASAAASLLADFQVGGTTQFAIRRNGSINVPNQISLTLAGQATPIEFDGSGTPAPSVIANQFIANGDVMLTGGRFGTGNAIIRTAGASSAVEVRGTTLTTPQTFRLYNTFTDASNYERGFMRWSSNVLQIGTEAGGTGSGARAIMFVTNGTNRWAIGGGGGSLVAQGAFPMETTGYIRAGDGATAGYQIGNASFVRLLSSSAGILLLTQAEGTPDFGRLQFGGTTSSFPALKRSSTTLQVRLADDSADAPFSSGAITTSGTVTANNTSVGFETSSAPNGASPVRFSADSGNVLIQTALNPGITEIRGTTATNPQTVRIFNTRTSSTNFERLNIRWASNECIIDAEAGSGGGTLRGIKIGSATSSLLGFYGATPVTQRAAIADATDAATTQARLNDLLAAMRSLGLIAT